MSVSDSSASLSARPRNVHHTTASISASASIASNTIQPMRSRFAVVAQASILGTLAACASYAPRVNAPVESRAPGGVTTAPLPTAPAARPLPPLPLLAGEPEHPHARWVPAAFAELPGWRDDRTAELWPALRQGCGVPAPRWIALCGGALRFMPRDDAAARRWLEQRLEVFPLESAEGDPT